MLKIGSHLSSSKGFVSMGRTAVEIGANTFQFFTRNPRGGSVKSLDLNDIAAYRAFAAEHGLFPILAHAPYTLNCSAADPRIREFARNTLADDLSRLEHIPGSLYNFHPGSHVGQGVEAGTALIAEALNTVLRPGQSTTVLLETMAGKGSEIGGTFAQLRGILDQVEYSELMGVCLDTCHVFDGGYDIVGALEDVLEEFDRTVGLNRLRAIHLNDSKNPFSSHRDRHEKIGQGSIGLEAFAAIINHPALRELPFYLETPQEDVAGYGREIALLRGLYRE